MKEATIKIGLTSYLATSLEGYTKSKFLKQGHSEEHYEKLLKNGFIKPEKEVKATKKKKNA